MRIYPAVHYTMGGLWVDYNLMSNVPGLYVLGEANFSDHGANRLGASALMQGLADGYFVLPATIGDYLAPLLGDEPGRRPTTPRSSRPRRASRDTHATGCSAINGHALGRLVPPRARQDHVGQLRHGPQRARASRRRSPRSPRCARSSGPTSASSARTRRSTSRSRRPAGSPTSSSSASCSCRDALPPRGELRRSLPRRAPDRGRRGAARRRRLRVRRRVGVARARTQAPDAPQGAARVRERRTSRSAATSEPGRARAWI